MNPFRLPRRSRPTVEWLEPRLLYSTDVPTPFDPSAAPGPAQVRMLEVEVETAHLAVALEPLATPPSAAEPVRPGPGGVSSDEATVDHARGRTVAFIDDSVPDVETLAAHALAAGMDVVRLSVAGSGLEQAVRWLELQDHSFASVHLLGHGTPGVLQLGTDRIDLATDDAVAERLLARLGDRLTVDADLFVYACDFAAGDGGQAALLRLAQLTRADIAASTDPTGHAAWGGNWVLESRIGTLEAPALDVAHWQGALAGPVLDLDADDSSGVTNGDVQRTWTRGSGPAAIVDPDAFLADIDSDQLELSARFLFRPGGVHDTLSTTLDGASFDSATGVLTWQGPQADAVEMLRSLRFDNAQTDASTAVRVVEIAVSDGVDTAIQRSFLLARSQAETLVASFDPGFDRLQTTGHELSLGISRGAALPSIPPEIPLGEPLIVRLGVVLASTRSGPFLPGDTVTVSLRATWNGPALASAALPASALGPAKAWFELDVGTLSPETLDALVDPVLRVDTNAVGGGVALGMDPVTVNFGQGSYLPDGQFTASPLAAFRWFLRDATTNNAPTLITGHTHTLVPTDEDTASPATLVSALLASAGWADTDPGALSGIAVTTATGNGTWQYSTDGATWTAFGSVSTPSSLLLAASTQVRYLPDTIAGETASFTYRAWDQTSGTASTLATPAYASTATTGGSSAFSANSAVAQIAVSSVNDAPVLDVATSPTLGSVLEGATNPTGVSVAALLVDGSLTDVDGAAVEAIAITGVNASLGAWQVSLDGGANWLTVDADRLNSTTNELALLLAPTAQIRLLPFGDLNGSLANALTFRAWDQTSGASGQYTVISATGGSTAYSAASDTASITVTAVNDAPTFAAAMGTGSLLVPVGPGYDAAYSTTVQPDGRILVAGYSSNDSDSDFSLIRLNADGTLDTTFGSGGKLLVPVGSGNDSGYSVTVQPDGRILVAGTSDDNIFREFGLIRLNPDGTLDTSFAADGTLLVNPGSNGAIGYSMTVQPDGRILVAGVSSNGINTDFSLVRLNADGTLDTSFDLDGRLLVPVGSDSDVGRSVTVQPDGRILVAGNSVSDGKQHFSLIRLNADGTLDTGFDADGKLLVPVGSADAISYSVTVQPDGRILVAGTSSNGSNNDFSLIRLNTDGTLDASFDADGKLLVPVGSGNDVGRSVCVQPDGRILVAGTSSNGSNNDFSLIRLNADGALDTTFGSGGKLLVPVGSGNDSGYSVTVQPDGRILVAGTSANDSDSDSDFGLIRLNADGTLDTTFGIPATNTLGGTVAYTEGSNPVVLDPDVRVFDAELSAAGSYAGASLTLARSGGASAQDLFSATGTLGPLTQGAALTVGGVTVGTVTANSAGTLTLTFDAAATEARVNAVMQQIAYANSSDAPPASVQIDWTFSDANAGAQGAGGALAATGSVTVSITAANDAPTLAAGHTHTLASTNEDTASPATLVSALLASAGWADADTGALSGIAIATTAGRGTWQYSTDGASWTAFGVVATSGSLLLDASTQVRYLPDTIAGETASFIYRAWDQTSGTASTLATPAYAATTTTGGSSAFSANSAVAQIAVSSVNDAPVLDVATSPTLGSVLEGATNPTGVSVAALLVDGSLTDVDGAAVEAIAITGVNASLGAWQVSLDGGANWLTVDADQLNSTTNELALLLAPTAQIRLLPFGDLNGTLTDALTFRAWDQTSGVSGQYTVISATGGSTAYSAADDTASITVTAVNDAPTFLRGDGIVTTSVSAGVDFETAYSSAIQPDGKILLGGFSTTGANADFALLRYNSDGSLDSSFGIGGRVTAGLGLGNEFGTRVALQPDGRILLGGATTSTGARTFALMRFQPDGSVDTSFGMDGHAITAFGTNMDAWDMAVQPDGRIVLGGYARFGGTFDFVLVRYHDNGTLDTAFGTNGKVATGVGVGNDAAYTLAIQSDGRILLAGTTQSDGGLDFALARYTVDGALDASFGDGGTVKTSFGDTNDTGRTLALQPDGRILLGGFTTVGGGLEFALTRYTANGTLDTTFGIDGKVVTGIGIGSSAPNGIGVTADGRIVLAGTVELAGGYALALARYQPDGSLDGSFGAAGIVTTALGDGAEGTARSVNLLPDGRIVIAGDARIDGRYHFMVARYSADGALDANFDVANTLGGTVSYTEGGSPVVLDPDVRVFDVELAAANSYAGATLTLERAGGASAQDVYSATGTLGALTPGGALVLGGITIGTVTTNSGGTLLLTFDASATEARVNAVMQQIAYAHSSDAPPASVQIDWTFSDANAGAQGSGGALAATGFVTVDITATNDAPTLATGHTHTLAPTDEDTASPGTAVSALLASAGWADADPGALSGIAVTTSTGNGTWQYSTDGATWTAFGSVSTPSSLLLAASTQVRYLPDSVAGETASFTYRAWDQTSGTASTLATPAYAATTTTGGASAFSASSALAQIVVASVNDAPVLDTGASPTLGSVLEGATNPAGVSVAALLVDGSLTDVDGAPVEAIALTGVNASLGAWQYSVDAGASWLTIDAEKLNSTTNELALLLAPTAQLRLLPFGDLNGSLTDAITFRAWDQTSGTSGQYVVIAATGGASAFSSASDTASITVAAVNDAPTFLRGDGIVTADVALGADQAWSLAMQPDGRVLVAGSAELDVSHVVVARFLPDGSRDPSFGSNGMITTRLGDGPASARDISVLPDGRIVIAGTARIVDIDVFAVARYHADGTPDASFGTDGQVITSLGRPAHSGEGVAVQSDGSVIVAGTVGTGSPDARLTVLRYTPTGVLDASFGTAGAVVTSYDAAASEGRSLALQPDGRILIGGFIQTGSQRDFALERYLPDGTADLSFGASGRALHNIGSDADVALSLHLQSDGRIVLAGYSVRAGSIDFALLRANADGSRDTTFGGSGVVVTPIGTGTDVARAVRAQPDGALVVAGFSTYDVQRVAIARYTAGGSLDTSFGEAGKVIADFGTGSAEARAIAITPDGGIVVAGYGNGATGRDIALLRYSADGALDASFDIAGTLGGTVSYTEGGSPVVLDPDVRVFDVELAAANSYAGATLTLERAGGASAQDVYSATGTLGALTPGGDLFVGGVTIGTVTTNSGGTLLLTFDAAATEARVNAVMQQIAYANSSDAPPASVQIDWTFSDANASAQGSGGALAATGSVTVDITATNDAPTLANGHTHTLAPTDEDTASPATLVSALLASAGWADTDPGALSGIAVTTATGNGTWQYSTDGATWTAFGSVSTPSSLLLAASTQVRYLPDSVAGETASFTYRAWDQTSGTASTLATPAYAATTTTGGASAFSASSALAQIVVADVNDAPTGRPRISGTADIGQGLDVDTTALQDVDGPGTLITSPEYQWLRSGAPIPGARGPVYDVTEADAGATLAVTVSWIDGRGTPEQVTSEATDPVPDGAAGDSDPRLPYVDPLAGGGQPDQSPASGGSSSTPGAESSPGRDDPAPGDGSSTPSSGQSAGEDTPSAPPGGTAGVTGRGAAGAPAPLAPPPADNAPRSSAPLLREGMTGEESVLPGQTGTPGLAVTGVAPLRAQPLDAAAPRAELAEALRQWRQRLSSIESAVASGTPTPVLSVAPTTPPAAARLVEDAGFTLGAAEGAYFTGLVATTGLVLWAARSGGLTLALLASVPIWRNLDPLYVLPADRIAGLSPSGMDAPDDPVPDRVPDLLPAAWRPVGRMIVSIDADA